MNYTELYTNTRATLCRAIAKAVAKAIAEQIVDNYVDIYCPDPLNPAQTFVGVYNSEGANYIECRLADGTLKSDSIYTLTVDQAYEVLKEVLAAIDQI